MGGAVLGEKDWQSWRRSGPHVPVFSSALPFTSIGSVQRVTFPRATTWPSGSQPISGHQRSDEPLVRRHEVRLLEAAAALEPIEDISASYPGRLV